MDDGDELIKRASPATGCLFHYEGGGGILPLTKILGVIKEMVMFNVNQKTFLEAFRVLEIHFQSIVMRKVFDI